jgi:hypothetical protein
VPLGGIVGERRGKGKGSVDDERKRLVGFLNGLRNYGEGDCVLR